MIINIGNESIETYPAKQFAGISLRLSNNPAQFLNKDQVRPTLPHCHCFIRAQDS
jgi:hypothetical protein